jgi:hypothetical protein
MLFDCPVFAEERDEFEAATSQRFSYDILLLNDVTVIKSAVFAGKRIFEHISSHCVGLEE